MAATPISSIITQVRRQLIETKKGRRFWDDDELKDIFKLGVMDLWGAILDLHQDHYFKVIEGDDARPVILEAGKSVLTNVPEDCFRVMLIEPNDTTVTDTTGGVVFAPRKYNHPDFITARTLGSLDSAVTAGIIYYDVTGPGAPIAAPVIRVAPKIGSNLTLRFAYYPMLEVDDINPVPGGFRQRAQGVDDCLRAREGRAAGRAGTGCELVGGLRDREADHSDTQHAAAGAGSRYGRRPVRQLLHLTGGTWATRISSRARLSIPAR
jgi:hypothetical protein